MHRKIQSGVSAVGQTQIFVKKRKYQISKSARIIQYCTYIRPFTESQTCFWWNSTLSTLSFEKLFDNLSPIMQSCDVTVTMISNTCFILSPIMLSCDVVGHIDLKHVFHFSVEILRLGAWEAGLDNICARNFWEMPTELRRVDEMPDKRNAKTAARAKWNAWPKQMGPGSSAGSQVIFIFSALKQGWNIQCGQDVL